MLDFNIHKQFYVDGAPLSTSNPLTPGKFACSTDLGHYTLPPLLSRPYYIYVTTNSPVGEVLMNYKTFNVKKRGFMPDRYLYFFNILHYHYH